MWRHLVCKPCSEFVLYTRYDDSDTKNANAFKKDHCGRSVANFVIGNQEINEFIGDNYNSAVDIGETNYVISVMANNTNVYVINSAWEMDLSGQVVTDSVGLNIFSGVGGQVYFLRWSSLVKRVNLLSVCLRDTVTIFVVWMFFFLLFFNFFSVVFCGLKGNQLIS